MKKVSQVYGTEAATSSSNNSIDIKSLNDFLVRHKVPKGEKSTHTSLSGGSYRIQDEEYKEFIRWYKDEIKQTQLHITERHKETSPVLIDLDFRQPHANRIYTHEIIKSFIKIISGYIKLYVVTDNITCYVLEKGISPRHEKGVYKDGVHIQIPNVITHPEIQYKIRERFLQEHTRYFSNYMPELLNNDDDIYDKSVIEKNGWFMYGSMKPTDTTPWLVSKCYIITGDDAQEIKVSKIDMTLVEILSIRMPHPPPTYTLEGKELLDVDDDDTVSTISMLSQFTNRACYGDDEIAKQLVDVLNPKRAHNYNDWMKLGWMLYNIDDSPTMLMKWDEFSKQSTKYKPGECREQWQKMKKGELGIGTLIMWAKEDNLDASKKILHDRVQDKLFKAYTGTHTDIARVVAFMYKNEFKCQSLKGNIWYAFQNHKWHEMDDGLELKSLISSEVFDEFMRIACLYSQRSMQERDENVKQMYADKASKYNNIALKLKNNKFKKDLLKECGEMMHDKKILNKLDSKRNMIGFDNGVYDLDAGIFRPGEPDDYVSMSVGYEYTDKVDHEKQDELMQFFRSIQPSELMSNYVICICAYMLDGFKFMEFLWFFTGKGRNGKGVISKLLKKTLGIYSYEPKASIFTSDTTDRGSATSEEIAKMKGKRCVLGSEPPETSFVVSRLKNWRGNDDIQARGIYKEAMEFSPQFGMIISMNDAPSLDKVDKAFAKTLKVVHFPYEFVDGEPTNEYERPIDPELKDKFEQNVVYHQQFMLILIEYYHKYIRPNGKRTILKDPPEVSNATQEYIDDNNVIGAWLEEYYEITKDVQDKIRTMDLYQDFLTDTSMRTITQKVFARAMKFNSVESSKSHGIMYYKGLKRKHNVVDLIDK